MGKGLVAELGKGEKGEKNLPITTFQLVPSAISFVVKSGN